MLLILSEIFLLAVFIGYAATYRAWGWVSVSATLPLLVGLLMWWMMPMAFSMDGYLFLLQYLLHFYLFAGGLMFLWQHTERYPSGGWIIRSGNDFLQTLALGAMVQHAAALVFAVLLYWQYPEGQSSVMLIRLMQFYLFNPNVWFAQLYWVMLVFWLHRRVVCKQSAGIFTVGQLQAGFLTALLLQFFHISGWGAKLFWLLLLKIKGS